MLDDATPRTVVQGMTIACPEGWIDNSMLILNAGEPGPSGVVPNLVVTRQPVPEDLPVDRALRLEAVVDGQVEQMRRALKDLKEVSRQHATAAHWSAELRIEWLSGKIPLAQWVTYANAGGDTFIVATATAGSREFADLEPAFQAMLQTVRLT